MYIEEIAPRLRSKTALQRLVSGAEGHHFTISPFHYFTNLLPALPSRHEQHCHPQRVHHGKSG